MFKWNKNFKETEFKSHNLVLPSVSVGNVGQLVVDFLLENVKPPPQKIGRVFHPALEPVIGTDVTLEGASDLTTPCELYYQPEQKLVIMQFHSPVLAKEKSNFVNFLVEWIKKQDFNQVICLSSTFASERIDSQLTGSPFRYLITDTVPDQVKESLSRCCNKLESRQFPAPAVHGSELQSLSVNDAAYIPGGGITKCLYETCRTHNIPFVSVIMFASDGCSMPDVLSFLLLTSKLFQLNVEIGQAQAPEYWKNGQLDEIAPSEIF